MARVEAVFALKDDMSSKLRSLATTAKTTERALNNLRKEVNHLIRRLEVLDKKHITITFNTRGYTKTQAEITALHRSASALNGKTVMVNIKTNRTGGNRVSDEMRTITEELKIPGTNREVFNTRAANRTLQYFEIRSKVIYSLLIASLGAVGPLTTAVQSLGLALTAVGSGFLAVGAAAGAAAAVGIKFFKDYSSKSVEQMNDTERTLYRSIENIKKQFDKVVSQEEVNRFGLLSAKMVDMGTRVLPMLNKTMEEFLSTFESLQKRFEKSFFEPRNAALFRNAIKPLPRQFESLAASAGHFGRILMGLQVAAAPLVTRLFEDIERYLGRKADYRTSAEGLKKSRDFFRDMRPVLDKVAGSLGNIYDNLAKIGRAGLGSGGDSPVINFLSSIDNLVDSIGTVFAEGADDFGNSLSGLINNLADTIDVVGPEVVKWLGRFADLVSNVLDLFRNMPAATRNLAVGLGTFLILRKIVPGFRQFTNLLGKAVKLLMTKGLGAAIGKFGGLGGMKIPGMGGTVADKVGNIGVQAVRIVSPVPLPVTMLGGAGGGTDVYPGGPGGGKGGRGGGGRGGRVGNFLRGLAGPGRLAGKAIPVLGTLLAAEQVAEFLSGEGPLDKTITPKQLSAHRGLMGGMPYMSRGRDIASDVLNPSNVAATFTMGKSGKDMVTRNILEEVKKLPPEMQAAGAKGAADMLKGLEAKGELARGSTANFLRGAREELTNFKQELAQLMTDLNNARTSQAEVFGRFSQGAPTPAPAANGGVDGNPSTPFARGGIVLGARRALLGERGPEAVIPLGNRARRDQLLRQAGVGGGTARGQRSSSPVINITGVTINSGDDMKAFVAQLEGAVRRAMTNIPHADAAAMLA